MPKTNTDISGGEVRLNLADLQQTALCTVSGLRNDADKITGEIRDKMIARARGKTDYVSIKSDAEHLKSVADYLIIAARTYDAVFAANDRESVIVVKD